MNPNTTHSKTKGGGDKIKLVIAGDYQQYKRWLWFHENLKGYEECRYIDSVDKLRGYTGDRAEIVLEGEYWKNPAYNSEELEYLGTAHNLFVVKPKRKDSIPPKQNKI